MNLASLIFVSHTIYALLLTYYFSRNQAQNINLEPLFVNYIIKDQNIQNPRNYFLFIHS